LLKPKDAPKPADENVKSSISGAYLFGGGEMADRHPQKKLNINLDERKFPFLSIPCFPHGCWPFFLKVKSSIPLPVLIKSTLPLWFFAASRLFLPDCFCAVFL
jgi:hypothetical protein